MRKFNFLTKATTLLLFVSIASSAIAQDKKDVTLSSVWKEYLFASKTVWGFNPLNDGKSYSKIEDDKINIYSYKTGKQTETVIDFKTNFDGISVSSYEFSNDESKLLLMYDVEPIYRHSSKEHVSIYDRNTKSSIKVSEDKIMYARISPDNKSVGYVKDNNIYIFDIATKTSKQITQDGKKNQIINGAVDWVYEEEFSMDRGFWWSPDSKKVLYYKFNESQVKQFTMDIYGHLYPVRYEYKYPKAGEANSEVEIYYYDNTNSTTKQVQASAEVDLYYPRIGWANNSTEVYIQKLNRLQNNFEILISNIQTGNVEAVYSETNKYYVDISDDLTFLSNTSNKEDQTMANGGGKFIITSERDGYNHIYLCNTDGEVKAVTKGNWDVTSFYGVDVKNNKVYYASAEESPLERYVYSINLDGTGKTKLTEDKGTNSAVFNKQFTYFMNTHSTINNPHTVTIRDNKGKVARTIEDNASTIAKLNKYTISPAEFGTLKTERGDELNYWMIKPANFDKNKKYPVLMYVYGGPGSQTVTNSWGWHNYGWYQMLASKGYIVVSVDNRGTGARGQEFKKMTYLQLGKYETEDQISAAKYLGTQPYVDKDRIGIWGWSYGGYMSSLCISKGADVFKMAIAVAPVTNWRYYDNIYTERFMRTPQENGENYDVNSPINHVDKIKGSYLIIHGSADDNVHYQNTMEMLTALIKANVEYDSEAYPNKNHSIYGGNTRYHLYNKMSNFIFGNL